MLRHMAHHLSLPSLVELHIDDQMDIKTLLGTYICTDLPGEFKWQPGVLTQAVTVGRWVVSGSTVRARACTGLTFRSLVWSLGVVFGVFFFVLSVLSVLSTDSRSSMTLTVLRSMF